ncbi:glycerate kinase [Curtobacterium flaccumfaciens]|nr:glycerate kinase [Curtobacterium flaccumfaciens]
MVLVPMADGGEGTLDAFETAVPGSVRVPVTVTGPAGAPVATQWLRLPDGRAVVELAATSGLPLLDAPMPDTATSRGFGEAIAAALDAGATGLVLGIGGSASTDGGRPVLEALGLDEEQSGTGTGTGGLRALPPLGVTVLTDVTSPLLGPTGAAAVFGPQKGITPDQVASFDDRLATWAARFPDVDPSTPGAGAAGGVGFGLLVWGATLAGGAAAVAEVLGLPALLGGNDIVNGTDVNAADVVISGEGRFDGQSAVGKVPSVVRDLTAAHAPGARSMLVAGAIEAPARRLRGRRVADRARDADHRRTRRRPRRPPALRDDRRAAAGPAGLSEQNAGRTAHRRTAAPRSRRDAPVRRHQGCPGCTSHTAAGARRLVPGRNRPATHHPHEEIIAHRQRVRGTVSDRAARQDHHHPS